MAWTDSAWRLVRGKLEVREALPLGGRLRHVQPEEAQLAFPRALHVVVEDHAIERDPQMAHFALWLRPSCDDLPAVRVEWRDVGARQGNVDVELGIRGIAQVRR